MKPMPMTLRERLLTAFRGGIPDRVPWNVYAGFLPETEAGHLMHRKGLSLMSIAHCCTTVREGVMVTEKRGERNGLPLIQVRIDTPVIL